jgi:hypothetical protein
MSKLIFENTTFNIDKNEKCSLLICNFQKWTGIVVCVNAFYSSLSNGSKCWVIKKKQIEANEIDFETCSRLSKNILNDIRKGINIFNVNGKGGKKGHSQNYYEHTSWNSFEAVWLTFKSEKWERPTIEEFGQFD